MTTAAPSAASRSAMARPIPRELPVTSAALPSSDLDIIEAPLSMEIPRSDRDLLELRRGGGGDGGEAVLPGQEHVDRGHHEQREEGADDHAADEHDADAVARPRAGPAGDHEREVADDGGRGRHQDRPQA